jgi:hypothetical protein
MSALGVIVKAKLPISLRHSNVLRPNFDINCVCHRGLRPTKERCRLWCLNTGCENRCNIARSSL